MRKIGLTLAIVAISFSFVVLLILGRPKLAAQQSKISPGVEANRANLFHRAAAQGRALVAGAEQLPTFCVAVEPTLTLTQDQQALFQQMATDISGFTDVPNDRLNYYSAVNNPPNYVINGWGGTVQAVQPNDCGYLVTVYVTPNLSTTTFGNGTAILTSDYCEIFQVTNDVVTYVGFTDPAGLAGQMPDLLGL